MSIPINFPSRPTVPTYPDLISLSYRVYEDTKVLWYSSTYQLIVMNVAEKPVNLTDVNRYIRNARMRVSQADPEGPLFGLEFVFHTVDVYAVARDQKAILQDLCEMGMIRHPPSKKVRKAILVFDDEKSRAKEWKR